MSYSNGEHECCICKRTIGKEYIKIRDVGSSCVFTDWVCSDCKAGFRKYMFDKGIVKLIKKINR